MFTDGKYLVLPSGELHIRDVGPEDGYKSYQCRTKHRLTGETRLSATKGRLVITGESTVQLFRVHKHSAQNCDRVCFLNCSAEQAEQAFDLPVTQCNQVRSGDTWLL
jgi:hypothetical protein